MANTRTVAVIIAAYRAERWIADCLDAWGGVEAPRGWQVDIRVGVDGCEATAATLDARGTPYRYSSENVGPYLVRNTLIEDAPADAYAIFDADDVPDPRYLKCLLPLAGTNGISGAARRTMEGDKIVSACYQYANGVCVISHNAWHKLGGYRPWRMAADHDLIQRAKALRIEVARHRQALYTRRRHPDSLTQSAVTGLRSRARRSLKDESAAYIAHARGRPELLRIEPETIEWGASVLA